MFNLGYTGKSQLDMARYKRLLAENKLSSFLPRSRQLEQFDHRKQSLTLKGAVESAERALKQVRADNLAELIEADHPVYTTWITQQELAANPGLVRSKNVRPPTGAGKIRLVCIGELCHGFEGFLCRTSAIIIAF